MTKIDIEAIPLDSLVDSSQLQDFTCGVQLIDSFLHNKAEQASKERRLSTTLFIRKDTQEIIGFYSLHTSSLEIEDVESKKIDSLPLIHLAYFAVEYSVSERGIGKEMMNYLYYELLQTWIKIGFVRLTVNSLADSVEFYMKCGFSEEVKGMYEIQGNRLQQYKMLMSIDDMLEQLNLG